MVDLNIDQSEPYIDGIDVPSEARPGESFTVTVTVGNESSIIAPQDGTCQSGILQFNTGWRTPVIIYVDGQEVHRETKCLDGNSAPKTVTKQVTLGGGEHSVTAEVLKVPNDTVAEERAAEVTVHSGAQDPALPTTSDRLTEMISNIADALGGTTQQVMLGFALAVVLLVVI
ncbi:hypothetical protein [Haloarcula argentinensis]|uniref:CARDB domain-containing protein n=1 Tax=Haloarcula argentinensis TaxID=43776 RepID=A0A830FVF7_HALAR|nr:hypothetical protein [Haloarcula argentinensis]GGM46284.1 hypothetical protein GCM10009006_29480 [Haloarcula argentinensis]